MWTHLRNSLPSKQQTFEFCNSNPVTAPFATLALPQNRQYMILGLVILLAFSLIFFVTLPAMALHAEVATAFGTLTTEFNALLDVAWPVVATVAVGLWVIGMFMRIVGRI